MNLITITGRLVAEPTIRTSGGKTRALFTLAVNRPTKRDENGNQPADYPNFVAFDKNAELLNEYAVKGQALEIVGHLTTSTYDKDGVRQYSTELIADRIQLGAKPRTNGDDTHEDLNDSQPDYADAGAPS